MYRIIPGSCYITGQKGAFHPGLTKFFKTSVENANYEGGLGAENANYGFKTLKGDSRPTEKEEKEKQEIFSKKHDYTGMVEIFENELNYDWLDM